MMQAYEAIWHGIIHGITNVLPLDPNTHSILLSRVMTSYCNLALTAYLSLGVALAVILFFRRSIKTMIVKRKTRSIVFIALCGSLSYLLFFGISMVAQGDIVWLLVLMAVVMGLSGAVFLLERPTRIKKIECLDDISKKPHNDYRRRLALVALSVVPGMSFSQTMMHYARATKQKTRKFMRVAILINASAAIFKSIITAVMLAAASKAGELVDENLFMYLLAAITAFAATLVTLKLFWGWLTKNPSLKVFACYSCVVSAIVLVFILLQ